MDKIYISLTDKNGNNFSYNEYEITPEEIAEYIKIGSLSFDGDKLIGKDDFIVEGKRLKCEIILPNNNNYFKDAIVSLLNDETKLITDSLPTRNVNALIFNKDTIVDKFKLRALWAKNYDDNWSGQTWTSENLNSGKLIEKTAQGLSQNNLRKIVTAICANYFHDNYSDHPGNGYVFQEEDINYNQTLNCSQRGCEIDGYKFDIGFLNLMDFMARGLVAHMNHTYGGYPNDSSHTAYGDYFQHYLNMIYDGLGTGLRAYIDDKFAAKYLDAELRDNCLDYLFIPSRLQHDAFPSWNASNSQPFAWYWLDEYLTNNQTYLRYYYYSSTNGVLTQSDYYHEYYQDEYGGYPYNHYNNRLAYRLGRLIPCFLQYWWYEIVQNEFVLNGFQRKSLPYNDRTSYVFLNNVMEAVVGLTADRNALSNVLPIVKYNYMHDTLSVNENVECLNSSITIDNVKIKIGEPKTLTVKTDDIDEDTDTDNIPVTDSGLEVIQVLNGKEGNNLFVPVRRFFFPKASAFYSSRMNGIYTNNPADVAVIQNGIGRKMLVDGFDYNDVAANPIIYDTWLTNTGYDDTNWLYFDNIGVLEISDANDDNDWDEAERIEIPVFDMENQNVTNDYGLYIYEEFFEHYYTKKKSNLMDVYVNVYYVVNDVPVNIYKGLVDFGSISYDKKSISFDATDVIGALFDNLEMLKKVVCFSQYNKSNRELIALPAAGNTIKEFVEAIIKQPFPYSHNLSTADFSLPAGIGLDNKILDELEPKDAFLIAVQLSKSMLYCDVSGKIQMLATPFNSSGVAIKEIDGFIKSKKFSKDIDSDLFSIEKIKNVAGWQAFAPAVATYYNSIRKQYTNTLSLEIKGQETEIKILDKIWIDGICYIVTEVSYDLRK